MSDIFLDVYLFFRGDCREAMEFYKSVFGGDLTIQSYKDVPGFETNHPNWTMHARLEGGDIKLMASDTEKASPQAAKVSLSLGGTDETRLREIFTALSIGGVITQELKKEFWGDIFGSLTDKFGIEWMMNITQPGSVTAKPETA
jgi:PhnB protein